jgi:hypothetical protein
MVTENILLLDPLWFVSISNMHYLVKQRSQDCIRVTPVYGKKYEHNLSTNDKKSWRHVMVVCTQQLITPFK